MKIVVEVDMVPIAEVETEEHPDALVIALDGRRLVEAIIPYLPDALSRYGV